ncbi:unnamed protein product, partial [Ectocarpus fasciculatus]
EPDRLPQEGGARIQEKTADAESNRRERQTLGVCSCKPDLKFARGCFVPPRGSATSSPEQPRACATTMPRLPREWWWEGERRM